MWQIQWDRSLDLAQFRRLLIDQPKPQPQLGEPCALRRAAPTAGVNMLKVS
jgi:hypothetical protein